ncbi:hypothetical protein M0811_11998 [Anaeramoeba ignava]|uniref:Uncharacterized protein n=1 Tax=Anaeramoeba ignava TaxID=1746090 RepID=A0A9Q0LA29_ANAIG|nr:hypothetical protein M0811_11998 [Anaeramoeba ignava]
MTVQEIFMIILISDSESTCNISLLGRQFIALEILFSNSYSVFFLMSCCFDCFGSKLQVLVLAKRGANWQLLLFLLLQPIFHMMINREFD